METFPNTHLQSISESYGSMPSSLLFQDQQGALHPPFTPSSPSLDMEAALQHLSSNCCDSELSSSLTSPDYPDVLQMVDPFLDYLNEVLMEEEAKEDVPRNVEASYHAIVSSLYDIIGQCMPLQSNSSEVISSFDLSCKYASSHNTSLHENTASGFHSSYPWDKSSHYELHAEITKPYTGASSLTRERSIPEVASNCLSACQGFDVSLENVGTLCVKQERADKSFRQMYNGPWETAHPFECALDRDISGFSFNNGGKAPDQEQNSNFDKSTAKSTDKSTAKSSSIYIEVEEFKDIEGYAELYIGKPGLSNASGGALSEYKKKFSRVAWKGSQSIKNISAEVEGLEDLRELLLRCAKAVAMGDVKKATETLQAIYQVHGASVRGNGLQRFAHYFCQALIARMGGMGGHCYRMMCENVLSVVSFLRVARIWYRVTPYLKTIHYFANQNILKAAEGASRLHILDYGIFYGMQWPCLINALADREGGPPLLVITGIDCSKRTQQNSLEWLEESGRRLAAYARTYNVPFQFHAIISDQWEDIDPASLHLQEGEVLVINCMKRLRHLMDETVDSTLTISPRQKLLMSMRSLNPHLLLTAEVNAACNSPFFVSRFHEALYFYSNRMDMLDTVLGDDPDRLVIETSCYSREILNIVACEGAERVERPEVYRRWHARIKEAGFELLPIPSVILSRSRSFVKQHYHKDFSIDDDAHGWMLLGWKGRNVLTASAWKPSSLNI